MNINVSVNVTANLDVEAKKFQTDQWRIADEQHYGKPVEWEDHEAYFITARQDSKVVGLLDLVISHGVGKIKDIIVDQTLQRHGIGRELMQEAERLSRKSGAHRMYLDTGKDWHATRFYESLGYEVEGTLRNYSFGKDFVFYTKPLK